jgi:hypothetical protein
MREWRDRYGKANEDKVLIPRDHWLEQWERDAIIEFHHPFPLGGLSPVDLPEAWSRHRGREPFKHLSGA